MNRFSFTGLDRFGRVVDQFWFNGSGGTVARYQYSYDQDSNVLTRDDLVNAGASQTYKYDSLDRLTEFKQGTMSDGSISSPTTDEMWNLDSLGNQLMDNVAGAAPISNTFDDQNRLTSVLSGSTTTSQTFGHNGNTLDASSG